MGSRDRNLEKGEGRYHIVSTTREEEQMKYESDWTQTDGY